MVAFVYGFSKNKMIKFLRKLLFFLLFFRKGFNDYVEPLSEYLNKWKQVGQKKQKKME